jgi:acid phosphatase/tartrate-resistant acid phosphatase type 5
MQWITDEITKSTADHLFVAGHYPVYSACQHGSTGSLEKNLKPLLEKYNAHYISGHDHC